MRELRPQHRRILHEHDPPGILPDDGGLRESQLGRIDQGLNQVVQGLVLIHMQCHRPPIPTHETVTGSLICKGLRAGTCLAHVHAIVTHDGI